MNYYYTSSKLAFTSDIFSSNNSDYFSAKSENFEDRTFP